MKISNIVCPPPVKARHVKRTYVSSPDDERAGPTRELIETVLEVVRRTLDVDVSGAARRMRTTPRWPDVWPGEHYKLLAGFVDFLKPKTVIEIGTHTGISALCLKQYLPAGSKLCTFDLIPWHAVPDTCLTKADFKDGALVQILADLADPQVFRRHADLLAGAELMFIDGPKNRTFEAALTRQLDGLTFNTPPWVLFDDIRDLNMLQFWRDLNHPKLDISSFGHWTGTGLVHWTGAR